MLFRGKRIKENSGFTLIEVLVAIIILAVMSVPFARAFATSAQTNRRARIDAKCNNAAENIAESFRNTNVEELIDKYDTDSYPVEYNDSTGVYRFEVHDQDLIKSSMPDGYYAEITLDPRPYENTNGLNLSQIAPVSIKDSAIYTMEEQFDNKAYQLFIDANIDACGDTNPQGYKDITASAPNFNEPNLTDKYAFLRENLYRTITFNIKKRGEYEATPVTGSGTSSGVANEVIDLIEVTMTIEYELKDYDGIFFASGQGNEKITFVDTFLFDNSISKQKYRGAYLFFYPRYLAGSVDRKRDTIIVENYDNIKSNVYLVALRGASDEVSKMAVYEASKGLNVKIYEDNDGSSENAAITLRTNMNTNVPYSSTDPDGDGDIKYHLDYINKMNVTLYTDISAADYLNAQNVDGKSLFTDKTAKRIYKMVVGIYDDQPPVTVTDPVSGATYEVKNPVVEFDGTKLEF